MSNLEGFDNQGTKTPWGAFPKPMNPIDVRQLV